MADGADSGDQEPFLHLVETPQRVHLSRRRELVIVGVLFFATLFFVFETTTIGRSGPDKVVEPLQAEEPTKLETSPLSTGTKDTTGTLPPPSDRLVGVINKDRGAGDDRTRKQRQRAAATKGKFNPRRKPDRKGPIESQRGLRPKTNSNGLPSQPVTEAGGSHLEVGTVPSEWERSIRTAQTGFEGAESAGLSDKRIEVVPTQIPSDAPGLITAKKIYMLFNPVAGQLFSQYNALVNFLAVGIKLDCCVIVMPSVVRKGMESLPSGSEESQFSEETVAADMLADKLGIGWAELFDVGALRQMTSVEIIEMSEFMKLPVWARRGASMSRLFYTKAETEFPRQAQHTAIFFKNLGFRFQRDDNRLGAIDVCDLTRSQMRASALAQAIEDRGEEIVLFGSMVRNCEARKGLHQNISKALAPVKTIRDLSTAFLSSLPSPTRHCVHVRFSEGDCVRSSRNLSPVIKRYAAKAIPEVDDPVFVAFHPRFKAVRLAANDFLAARKAATTRSSMENFIAAQPTSPQALLSSPYGSAVLDAWTCAQADNFLGAIGSSTSVRIGKWMRARNENATVHYYVTGVQSQEHWNRDISTC